MPPAPAPTIRPAAPAEEAAVRALLAASGLPSADVSFGAQEFLVALQGARLVGCVGLAPSGADGFLRSLAVAAELRGQGLGDALHRRALELARRRGVQTLYLLTATAEAFFASRGYARVAREDVPAAVRASLQFAGLCPSSAACLRRSLGPEP